jgi:hypothetical protein
MKTSYIEESIWTMILCLLGVYLSLELNVQVHVWEIALFFVAVLAVVFVPWTDVFYNTKLRFELRKVESSFPGARATKLQSTGGILLTDKATGATLRELAPGCRF